MRTLERRLRALENRINESDGVVDTMNFINDLANLMDKYPDFYISGWPDGLTIFKNDGKSIQREVAKLRAITPSKLRTDALKQAKRNIDW